jgi:hypothetical protein
MYNGCYRYITRSNTPICHNKNNPLANRSQVYCGLPSPAHMNQELHKGSPGLRQSTLKFGPLVIGQRYKFERGVWQQSEIHYQPFYIDSPPVRGAVSFLCTT